MEKVTVKKEKVENLLLKKIKIITFNIFVVFFNWFIVLLCLIILAASYWWLIKPKYDFISTNKEISFREEEYNEKVKYLTQLNDVKNLYKKISQADKDKIDLILSVRQDLDRLKIILLREVDKAAKERGATADNVVITPLDNSFDKFIKINETPKNKNLFDKLRLVQVSFSAKDISYEQLKRLLARLEMSLRVMDVTDLGFNPLTKEATIKLVTYYLEQ